MIATFGFAGAAAMATGVTAGANMPRPARSAPMSAGESLRKTDPGSNGEDRTVRSDRDECSGKSPGAHVRNQSRNGHGDGGPFGSEAVRNGADWSSPVE